MNGSGPPLTRGGRLTVPSGDQLIRQPGALTWHTLATHPLQGSPVTRSGEFNTAPDWAEEVSHSYQFISAVKTSFLASQNRLQGVQNSEKLVAKNAQMLNGQISHNSVLLPILFHPTNHWVCSRALPASPSQITFLCHQHLGLHRLNVLYPLNPQESRETQQWECSHISCHAVNCLPREKTEKCTLILSFKQKICPV